MSLQRRPQAADRLYDSYAARFNDQCATCGRASCAASGHRASTIAGRQTGAYSSSSRESALLSVPWQSHALITSGEHYGAVLNPDFDYHRYLVALEAGGLNYTRLFGGSYVEVPAKSFGILRNDLAPGPGRYLAPWARSGVPGYAGGEISSIWTGGIPRSLRGIVIFCRKRRSAESWLK